MTSFYGLGTVRLAVFRVWHFCTAHASAIICENGCGGRVDGGRRRSVAIVASKVTTRQDRIAAPEGIAVDAFYSTATAVGQDNDVQVRP